MLPAKVVHEVLLPHLPQSTMLVVFGKTDPAGGSGEGGGGEGGGGPGEGGEGGPGAGVGLFWSARQSFSRGDELLSTLLYHSIRSVCME
jgi:hypothetical protein